MYICKKSRDTVPGKAERQNDAPLLYLLLAVAVVYLAIMPNSYYQGDNVAPRVECINLLESGRLGIDPGDPRYSGFFKNQADGQYFFRNEKTGRYYSKYGILNTVIYILPLVAERLVSGKLDPLCRSMSLLFFISVLNLAFTVGVVYFLYRMVSMFTETVRVRIASVLIILCTTFVWYYLRAPALEVFQMLPFMGYCYYGLRLIRADIKSVHAWRHMAMTMLFLALLIFLKTFFIIYLLPLWVIGILKARRDRGMPMIKTVVIPTGAIVLLLLLSNYIRFGSVFETGYSQWASGSGEKLNYFSPRNIPASFLGFFIRPGNPNVFLSCPVFLFALVGLKGFVRKFKREAIYIGSVFLLTVIPVCMFSDWKGGWSHGPRYLVHVLVIGSLPFVETLAWLMGRGRFVVLRWTCVALMGAVLVISFKLQLNVNSLRYFAVQNIAGALSDGGGPVDSYFGNAWHHGIIAGELIAYRRRERMFYPLKVILDENARGQRERMRLSRLMMYDLYLDQWISPNFMMLSSVSTSPVDSL